MESCAKDVPGERRRNLRHTAASIIYVELGSGNGGIVVNLGMEGLAFQAACKLTTEAESTLNIRLQGAGLNAELVGDVVWLGATQKEVGVHFKSVSAEAKHKIADWIARREQVCQIAALRERSPHKSDAAPARGRPVSGARFVSNLSTPAPRTMSATPRSRADAQGEVSRSPISVDSAPGTPGPVPLPKNPSPNVDHIIPSSDSGDRSHKAPLINSSERLRMDRYWLYRQRLGAPRAERSAESPIAGASPIVLPDPAKPRLQAEPARIFDESSNMEIRKTAREATSLRESRAVKRFARMLIAVVRRATRQQKLLLASAAAGGVCLLILSLHISSPRNRPPSRGFVQQSGAIPKVPSLANDSQPHTAAPIVSSVGSGSHTQSGAAPVGSSVAEGSHPQSDPAEAPVPPVTRTLPPRKTNSFLTDLAEIFLGSTFSKKTSIDPHQDHVQVWVSKKTGYYYCADSPYYGTLQPGAFMTQGGALQSGYQPKLSQPCN